MRKRGAVVAAMLGAAATAVGVRWAVEVAKRLDGPGRVTIRGTVVAGQRFVRPFGPGFRFELVPGEHGWWIGVKQGENPTSLTAYTPPLHLSTNPCYLVGWHLRNEDNTGPNEPGLKNVNAPGLERDFAFLPASSLTADRYENARRALEFGRGRLEVLDHELKDLEPGQRAGFARVKFRVVLEWPPEYEGGE